MNFTVLSNMLLPNAVKKAVASFATNFMDWIDIQLLFSLFIFSTSKMEKTT